MLYVAVPPYLYLFLHWILFPIPLNSQKNHCAYPVCCTVFVVVFKYFNYIFSINTLCMILECYATGWPECCEDGGDDNSTTTTTSGGCPQGEQPKCDKTLPGGSGSGSTNSDSSINNSSGSPLSDGVPFLSAAAIYVLQFLLAL